MKNRAALSCGRILPSGSEVGSRTATEGFGEPWKAKWPREVYLRRVGASPAPPAPRPAGVLPELPGALRKAT